jgi:hypothetical protein
MGEEVEEELEAKCPVCGRPFEPIAFSRQYVIYGCPEHREFDRIHHLET